VSVVGRAGDTAIPTNGMVLSISQKADSKLPAVQPGDILQISTAFEGDVSTVQTAMGGGPPLLEGGQIIPKPAEKPVTPAQRAPRTAVGFNATNVYMVVVDGRQPLLSIGMDHRELAEFMQSLGCTDALNLDGGGSCTFWLAGRVVNSPSEWRLRPVGNCLILLRRSAPGD
jgi:exopolysaccharide biosynthesis protein